MSAMRQTSLLQPHCLWCHSLRTRPNWPRAEGWWYRPWLCSQGHWAQLGRGTIGNEEGLESIRQCTTWLNKVIDKPLGSDCCLKGQDLLVTRKNALPWKFGRFVLVSKPLKLQAGCQDYAWRLSADSYLIPANRTTGPRLGVNNGLKDFLSSPLPSTNLQEVLVNSSSPVQPVFERMMETNRVSNRQQQEWQSRCLKRSRWCHRHFCWNCMPYTVRITVENSVIDDDKGLRAGL